MKLEIISGSRTGIFKRLESLGLITVVGVNFARHPVRINGIWRCAVIV